MEDQRVIPMNHGESVANQYMLPFMETSAFDEITRMILDNKLKKMNPNPYMPTVQKRLKDRNQNNRRDRCC